jgi:type 2 lantibiotic biosynthesis protein LanM
VTPSHFDNALGCLISPRVDELATQLTCLAGLGTSERDVITEATRQSLLTVLNSKLSRLLVLELNAARVMGRLSGQDPKQRWEQFLEISSQRTFWDDLAPHYPTLLSRTNTILRNRCSAILRFAQRWVNDRPRLAQFCGKQPGRLEEIRFGAGDSHRGGLTVALLGGEDWHLVYKPRPLAIDNVLRGFVTDLAADHGRPLSIHIPEAFDAGEYGWVEFVNHRYADSKEELASFYRGVGQCLALMRLLGGTDLHAENVIAQGGTPVLVDCETLFTPRIPPSPSGFGGGLDRAAELLGQTVLSVGLLPGRGVGLGWRGVDASAVGMLPEEQPMQMRQGILDAGSDKAHVGLISVEAPASQNHPSPRPALAEHWPEVLRGFDELTATLQSLEAGGTLRSRLEAFRECRIRVVLRPTEVYAEVGRMLWHPASLHKEVPAQQRAFELLRKMAANVSSAPSDTAVIKAEIDELLEGDIPYFWTVVREGRLHGPRDTSWLPQCDLLEAALANWRQADFAIERSVIQASLVSAYINDGWRPNELAAWPKQRRGGDLEARRRRQAAHILHGMVANAFYGDDGTVAWIAPVLSETGWAVQTLRQDLYNGISGVALLAAGYLHESAARRADPVPGLEKLCAAALSTLHVAEARRQRLLGEGLKIRPPAIGGYMGISSQIWTYLVLNHWKLDSGDGVQRACKLAEEIPAAAQADGINDDLISGTAGAIAPLLFLARKTGDVRYANMASQLGELLQERAHNKDGRACWTRKEWPNGIGGFAHGVSGTGWALTHLARVTESTRHQQLADEAFAFEDALWDEQEQNWLDLRLIPGVKSAAAWCHGAVGIGLARLSLDRELTEPATRQTLNRAAGAVWRQGIGWNHCACHGDLGAWELLHHAIAAGEGPKGVSDSDLLDIIVTSIEQHGPFCGIAADAFVPGLLPGVGGIAYQLLRAHPEAELPSILTPSGEEF